MVIASLLLTGCATAQVDKYIDGKWKPQYRIKATGQHKTKYDPNTDVLEIDSKTNLKLFDFNASKIGG